MKRYRLPAAALLGVLAVIALYGLIFSQVSAQDIRDSLAGLGSWAPAAYVGLFVLLPAMFFPVAVLALAGDCSSDCVRAAPTPSWGPCSTAR